MISTGRGLRPSRTAHRVLSSAAGVLELPAVWAVRRLSPERLTGFLPAAIADSLLWGIVLVGLARGRPWRARRSRS